MFEYTAVVLPSQRINGCTLPDLFDAVCALVRRLKSRNDGKYSLGIGAQTSPRTKAAPHNRVQRIRCTTGK